MALLSFSALLVFAGCQTHATSPSPQAEPILIGAHVYRGDMGDQKGLLFYSGPSSNLTVVYDTVRCGLVCAWKGPVLGPLRDAAGAYAPQGPVYHLNPDARFWTVLVGGDTVAFVLRCDGFTEDSSGSFTLRYALDLPAGHAVTLTENPVHDDHYGDQALFRNITCKGLDGNTVVRLKVGGRHPLWAEVLSVSPDGVLTGSSGNEILTLSYDGISVLKTTWIGSGDI